MHQVDTYFWAVCFHGGMFYRKARGEELVFAKEQFPVDLIRRQLVDAKRCANDPNDAEWQFA